MYKPKTINLDVDYELYEFIVEHNLRIVHIRACFYPQTGDIIKLCPIPLTLTGEPSVQRAWNAKLSRNVSFKAGIIISSSGNHDPIMPGWCLVQLIDLSKDTTDAS